MKQVLLGVLALWWLPACASECTLLRDNASGVVGMDGSASTALGDGRSLFVFGDTFFGSINGGNGENGEREIREMVDYSFAIVSDAAAGECFAGASIVRDRVERDAGWESGDRFWPGHGLRVGNAIVLFFVHARVTDPTDSFGFEVRGAGVVSGPADDLHFDLAEARYLPSGYLPGALLTHAGSAYVYLCRPDIGFECVLARTTPERLARPSSYQYYVAGRGYGGALEEASVVVSASAEFSVSFIDALGGFVVVDIEPFAGEITMRKGGAPEGPFSERQSLLPCRLRDDEFCYGAKLHPQLSVDGLGFIHVTYNTNLMQYDPRSYADRPELYWPRLVRLELSEVAD